MWKAYYTPTTVDDALQLLAQYGPEARVIAGGTDLLVELERGVRKAGALIDVTRIAGLDEIDLDDRGWIHVGPTVTHNQVVASQLIAGRGAPLAQACWLVGSPQLRNRGTVAGNLVTASPANDAITALWALDARLTLRSVRDERALSLADFYHGVRKTALAPDEMVTDISFPALASHQRGTFVKLGLRRTHAIAVVNAAAVLTFERSRVLDARITLGSVAPTIIHAPEAEELLRGRELDDPQIARAADLAAQAASPIDDIRAGADYRRHTVRVLVRRALTSLFSTTGSPQSRSDQRSAPQFPNSPPMLWGTSDGRFPPLHGETASHHDGAGDAIRCTVNGEQAVVYGAESKTLLQMLRDDLGLTGTKNGCGEGECGACTVWMDGIAVLACLVPAPRAHGTQIVTVEGLALRPGSGQAPQPRSGQAQGENLHPVQQAFIDEGAVQCGYCTPGFIMSGANLLQEIPHPTREQIVAGLSGNLCRCTGYYTIVRAIERAAQGD
jgi:xanthine dehydrogenase iron-sulfur cluster and FAD-binding subunit A